jgi:hypothetical protein
VQRVHGGSGVDCKHRVFWNFTFMSCMLDGHRLDVHAASVALLAAPICGKSRKHATPSSEIEWVACFQNGAVFNSTGKQASSSSAGLLDIFPSELRTRPVATSIRTCARDTAGCSFDRQTILMNGKSENVELIEEEFKQLSNELAHLEKSVKALQEENAADPDPVYKQAIDVRLSSLTVRERVKC